MWRSNTTPSQLVWLKGVVLMSDYEILTIVVAILVLTETIRNSRQ